MLTRFLLRLYLFYKGIRFYRTTNVPKSPEFKQTIFRTVAQHELQFYFYREISDDLIYRRGRIREEKFTGYVLQVKLDDNLPEIFRQFNNLKFFFKGRDFLFTDEKLICDCLLNIFVDFLKHELERTK